MFGGRFGRGVFVIVGALLVLGMGCSSWRAQTVPEVGDFQVRPASGDTARILRNATYYQLMGRPEMALKELEEARRIDSPNLALANRLAEIYEKLGRMEDAQKVYLEALAQDSDNQAIQNNLCYSYYLAGNFKQAESCFRQTLERQPGNAGARNNLGLLLCRLGRQEEARQLWQEAEGATAADQKLKQAQGFLASGAGPAPAAAAASKPVTPVPGPQAKAAPAPTVPPPAPGKQNPPVVSPDLPQLAAAVSAAPARALPASKAPEVESPQGAASPASGRPAATPKPREAKATPRVPPAIKQTSAAPRSLAAPPPPAPPAAPKLTRPPASPETPPGAPRAQEPQSLETPERGAKTGPRKEKPPLLTSRELGGTAIEVRNGNGIPDSAREARHRLSLEGFNVVDIANHIDFGVDRTLIYYRPEAEKVARALKTKFFQEADLQVRSELADGVDVKVLLGRELSRHADAALPGRDKSL